MARHGENIHKRKDGRWEGRYIKARTPDKRSIGDMFMGLLTQTLSRYSCARRQSMGYTSSPTLD